ncbi:MAG: CHASE3 domain-containing protein [Rhodospirillaceae bacterium]|nr:CHASE3 domain-containing protein [Rhodospirillaceae bacterium]
MDRAERMESIVRYGIIALALYLAAASVAMYTQIGRLRDAQERVSHTQEVRYALQNTLSLVLDAESVQRGFVLTKLPVYIASYNSAVTKLRAALEDVSRLTIDDAVQKPRVAELRELVGVKIQQMDAAINFAKQVDPTTAVDNYRSGSSRTIAAEIREKIEEMLEEESRLFAARNSEMRGASRITAITFVALLILFAGVAAAYFVLSNRNVTIRNAMLTELTDAKVKSEKADQFKGDLLNYLGTALYDPLSKIATSTDLLLYRSDNRLSDSDGKIVGEIRATIRFLLSLANNFLHIGRLQAGKTLQLEEDDVDLMEIVREAVSITSATAAKNGIMLTMSALFGRALIRCDKQKLRQIFLNLLDNAVKNTPPGGSIEVSAMHMPTGDVTLTFRDTGHGIPPERMSQVMIPFAQIENMFERQKQGIGLGLPMALGFAQAHGGSLHLESQPQRGTTAAFTLPASRVIRIFAPT